MSTRLYQKHIGAFMFCLAGIPSVATAGQLHASVVPQYPIHVLEMPKSVAGMSLVEIEKWAHLGDPAAENALGVDYLHGRGVRENWKKADIWFRKSAHAGNANGAFLLAFAYNFGEGVPMNTRKAVYWWQQSAKDRRK
ncbi:tetratricopeptide repeat protein [Acidithiobacillus marinus]|uniref:tetratricopeptide repeat protein n=1 Tax=Acidithiobacillus marinus TaxID=187490 RepID=UPI00117A13C2|nr:tetratricopeptide repeat protein [Acidithiobacillus marinus]